MEGYAGLLHMPLLTTYVGLVQITGKSDISSTVQWNCTTVRFTSFMGCRLERRATHGIPYTPVPIDNGFEVRVVWTMDARLS